MYVEQELSDAWLGAGRCRWLQVASSVTPVCIVPDACMDVMWLDHELVIAGTDTRPMLHRPQLGARVLGVRFAPGHGARLLGLSAEALRDARVPLAEFWGDDARRLSDRVASAGTVEQALALLEQAVGARSKLAAPADPLIDRLVQRFSAEAAPASVAALARAFGVSERQLLRRCTSQLGYGPKFLLRVLRFQRFLRALAPDSSLPELALAVGYADQAHLTHDVAELAASTPSQLRRELRLRTMSDSDKTSAVL
jgi:AraC-like DNA-binding protein